MLKALVRLARPGDWIKNVFVVIPVPFAVRAGAEFHAVPFLLGLAGFCLINSAVYTLNDLCDAVADRLHPRKRNRPLASGEVTRRVALAQTALLLVFGLALCLAARRSGVMPLVTAYLAVNLVYSLGAKRAALLDVFLLASGYVIRVLLGCVLVAAAPSTWLLLCASALALFLVFTKRRADLALSLDADHRGSLDGYTLALLDQATVITAAVAIVCYALYCIDAAVLVKGREMASIPFVAFGILNYLRLAHADGAGGSPVEIAYRSRSCQVCAVGWIVAVTWSLGMW